MKKNKKWCENEFNFNINNHDEELKPAKYKFLKLLSLLYKEDDWIFACRICAIEAKKENYFVVPLGRKVQPKYCGYDDWNLASVEVKQKGKWIPACEPCGIAAIDYGNETRQLYSKKPVKLIKILIPQNISCSPKKKYKSYKS